MSKNTFSPSMTLAGMDYIAPSAACIKPTMMRIEQKDINSVPTVGRHEHNTSIENNKNFHSASNNTNNYDNNNILRMNDTNNISEDNTLIRGNSRFSSAPPEVLKITLQDCLACSGCVTTAETILVNAQSKGELLRTRAEHLAKAISLRSSEHQGVNAGTQKISKEGDYITQVTYNSSIPPWLITISEQSASSIAAYLSCSVNEAYKIIAGFMYYILTQKVPITEWQDESYVEGVTTTSEDSKQRVKECDLLDFTNVKCTERNDHDSINNDINNIITTTTGNNNMNSDNNDNNYNINNNNNNTYQGNSTHIKSLNVDNRDSGEFYVSDLRWASRLSALKTAEEYECRVCNPQSSAPLPLLVSACPGWVCYCEKQGAALLPHLCPVLSPQGIAGSLAKRLISSNLYHVSVQPCFDRKLEAARDRVERFELTCLSNETSVANNKAENTNEAESIDYLTHKTTANNEDTVFYTDCVISTLELLEWMEETDSTFPWRRELNSIDDVEDYSEYKSIPCMTLVQTEATLPNIAEQLCAEEEKEEEYEEQQQQNPQNPHKNDCEEEYKDQLEAKHNTQITCWENNSNECHELQQLTDRYNTEVNNAPLHNNKEKLGNDNSISRINTKPTPIPLLTTSSSSTIENNVDFKEVAVDVALWEGSGGYHRHVIHHMLLKQSTKKQQEEQQQQQEEEELECENHEESQQKEKRRSYCNNVQLRERRDELMGEMSNVRYEVKRNRNHQLITISTLPKQVFCIAYGFQQIQNIVRGLRKRLPSVRSYTFVEMMACPDGCLNGGGQIRSRKRATQSTSLTLDEQDKFLLDTKVAFTNHIIQESIHKKQKPTNVSNADNSIVKMSKTKRGIASDNTLSQSAVTSQSNIAVLDHTICNTNDIAQSVKTFCVNDKAKQPVLFSYAQMSKFAEQCGSTSWLCKFTDRQKEFEQMLNEGNLHSLKW